MKGINIYIIEKLKINKDSKLDNHLSDEDLEYEFKIKYINHGKVKDILEHDKKFYDKDTSEKLKKEIELDKFLSKYNFKQNEKNVLKYNRSVISDNIYYLKSKININGYCIIFEPFSFLDHYWNFLVTKANGKTLHAVEFIEETNKRDDLSIYGEIDNITRKNFDNIYEAWEYIESKYGKF